MMERIAESAGIGVSMTSKRNADGLWHLPTKARPADPEDIAALVTFLVPPKPAT